MVNKGDPLSVEIPPPDSGELGQFVLTYKLDERGIRAEVADHRPLCSESPGTWHLSRGPHPWLHRPPRDNLRYRATGEQSAAMVDKAPGKGVGQIVAAAPGGAYTGNARTGHQRRHHEDYRGTGDLLVMSTARVIGQPATNILLRSSSHISFRI